MSYFNNLDDLFKNEIKSLSLLVRGKRFTNTVFLDQESKHKLIIKLHQDWKKAQKKVIKLILSKLKEINNIESDVEHKYSKVKKIRIANLKLEILILRRLFDSIIWFITGLEDYKIRRLMIKNGNSNFSFSSIRATIPAVNDINKDPKKIALITDLTTFCHIGDVVVSDITKGRVTFIELKEGKKNTELTELVIKTKLNDENFSTKSLNPKDNKHYNRIKNQMERLSETCKILNFDKGSDKSGFTKNSIEIKEPLTSSEFFTETLVTQWEKIKSGKSYAIDEIDGCLYVGSYKNLSDTNAFSLWMSGINNSHKIFNILDSFKLMTAMPLFASNLPTEMINSLIDEKLHILLCLDIDNLILAHSHKYGYQDFKIMSLKQSRKTIQKNRNIEYLLNPNKQIITMKGHILGAGLLDRIYFKFQKPLNLLSQIEQLQD